jgi:hypothetical protein
MDKTQQPPTGTNMVVLPAPTAWPIVRTVETRTRVHFP